MRSLFFFIILSLLVSCSGVSTTLNPTSLNETVVYNLEDGAGNFSIQRETVCTSKKCVTKQQILETNLVPVERMVSVSEPVHMKIDSPETKGRPVQILRPRFSSFFVWLEGKRYFSEIRTDFSKDIIKARWSGDHEASIVEKEFPLSKKQVYCFFSQIIECANLNGFISLAMRKKTGTMTINLIWDGHPWFQGQYVGAPDEIFSPAKLLYNGEDEDRNQKFALKMGDQIIFYHVNKKGQLLKKFWVSQGLSQYREKGQ